MTDGTVITSVPKRTSVKRRAAEVRQLVSDTVTDQDVQDMVLAMVKEATGGNVLAFRELMDRTAGRTVQQVEVNDKSVKSREQIIEDFMHAVGVRRTGMRIVDNKVIPDHKVIPDREGTR